MRLELRHLLSTHPGPTRCTLPLLQRNPVAGSTLRSFNSSSNSCVMVPSSLTVRSSFIDCWYDGGLLFSPSLRLLSSISLSAVARGE
ncbi:hypothetical protein D3C84_1176910 [compost metagenome]